MAYPLLFKNYNERAPSVANGSPTGRFVDKIVIPLP